MQDVSVFSFQGDKNSIISVGDVREGMRMGIKHNIIIIIVIPTWVQ